MSYGTTPLSEVPVCGDLFACARHESVAFLQSAMHRAIRHFQAEESDLMHTTNETRSKLYELTHRLRSTRDDAEYAQSERQLVNARALIAVCEDIKEEIRAERHIVSVGVLHARVNELDGIEDGQDSSVQELCGLLHRRFGKILDWNRDFEDAQFELDFRS